MTAGANRGGAAAIAVATTLLVCACAPPPRAAAPAATALLDAVVLVEEHRIEGVVDTLVTWIAPGRVRISHRGGDAILDAVHDRFLLLDPATRTVREASLREWEGRIRTAALTARAAADSAAGVRADSAGAAVLRFEPAGDGGTVAGHPCQRHHLFAERPLFPGEWEEVEQEIWVALDIELPAGAVATYQRVFASLDWIDFDARVERPPGVRLRLVSRRRPRGGGAAATEVETTEVVRIERRRVGTDVFAAPAGWLRADSHP